ncbi:Cytochrome oxidase complex assembly protein 1 [Crateriforma conspicua]|uniref:Cytochrome oxidase complex assembly protein 1 n=1 Tax=Crateriforma conspicua TaxID=2527996 RepID=A0A5C6FU69_9PLAN|nr:MULTISPECIES: cytochrome c oxidase assembly factor Coa1 family protein [Crateriforma]TWU65018.1 Cytochrome oxidase complex assembly protein 1 [Crateriforma conspicua]
MSDTLHSPQHSPMTSASADKPKSRTGCLLMGLGGGCLGVVLLCGGVMGFGVFSLFTLIKSSDPYQQSLARAQANETLIAELGQPIEAGWMLQGNINLNDDDGDADLTYPISGPNGSATVKVKGSKQDGVWTYEIMRATVDGSGTQVDLGDATTESQEESVVEEVSL